MDVDGMSSPAFQFYPQDFLVGTADMSPEEVGVYIRLLCYQWSKDGLPNDQAKCAAMAGCHGNAIASVWHKFGICQDGRMRNSRLEEVRAEQVAYRAKQANNAQKRWANRKEPSDATALPPHMPNACPSSSPSPTTTTAAKVESREKKQPAELDEQWLTNLQNNEAYKALNIRVELGKAQVWCESNNRVCTKRFFTNWINRAHTATRAVQTNATNGNQTLSPHNALSLNRTAASSYRQIGEKLRLGMAGNGAGEPPGASGAAQPAS
jgi:uncharacterized protein YdaU (DUF1376 family)